MNNKELKKFPISGGEHCRSVMDAIDATKLENSLGWRTDETFDTGIVKRVEWYLKRYKE